jgi:amidophosphoribosyltransferase
MVYQEVADMTAAITRGSGLSALEDSCFSGKYIAGSVDEEYLTWVEEHQLS